VRPPSAHRGPGAMTSMPANSNALAPAKLEELASPCCWICPSRALQLIERNVHLWPMPVALLT